MRDRNLKLQAILSASARVFIRKGFRAARMEEIAAAAGIGVGTLYHYYRSKDTLFASLLSDATRVLAERLARAAEKRVPPALGLVAIARAYVDYFVDHPDYFRIVMSFQTDGMGRGAFAEEREKIEKVGRQSLELLATKVREGQDAGVFRKDIEPMAAATALWASYNGTLSTAMNRTLLQVAGLSVEQLLSAAAFLQFSGLSADPSVGPVMLSRRPPAGGDVSVADIRDTVRAAPWIEPAAIFAGMRMAFRSEKAADLDEIYRFEITGARGGRWTVSVHGGEIEVTRGDGAEPTVTIETSDKRFIDLVTGEANAIQMIVEGEMKIAGDLRSAARFQSLFLPDRPQASAQVTSS